MLMLPAPRKYIVSVSGGLGSAEALKRTIERYGKENTVAVFADAKGDGLTHTFSAAPVVDALLHERYGGESRDLYRFLWQLSAHFEIPIERLEDGRTIWRVFADNRAFRLFSGGVFVHKCSDELKRQTMKRYILSHYQQGTYAIVLGMGWDEPHRVTTAQAYWRRELGWAVDVLAPNADAPYVDNCTVERWIHAAGIETPAAYTDGFEHNNCGGGCISAGQGHFANLYKTRKDVYLYWAYMEAQIQRVIGKRVTILKDERGGETRPLSLYEFIPRIEAGDYRKLDWGGCGCFVGQLSLFDMPVAA
jgi:hypothetical protein